LFVRSDGSTGSEAFAHGGLYPEEVLIPWIEYVRTRVLPQIRGSAHGKVRRGARSTLTVRLTNPSNEPVTIVAMDIRTADQTLFSHSLETMLPPLETRALDVELPEWPGPLQSKFLQPVATLRTTRDELFTSELENQIEVLAFQEREIEDTELWTLG
ncbi:MAG: hypothetical protein NZ557_14535, partial [Chthonomonadaceae bacterium]|nr:hypothetical protein [Chthonomonadaceae bacterium]